MQMVNAFIIRFFAALMGNVFIQLLLIAVCADMVFGSLRAAKYHCWNSAVGIDGAIRKAEMIPGRGGIGLYSWGVHVDTGKYSRWNE